jgi:hypothetical protein
LVCQSKVQTRGVIAHWNNHCKKCDVSGGRRDEIGGRGHRAEKRGRRWRGKEKEGEEDKGEERESKRGGGERVKKRVREGGDGSSEEESERRMKKEKRKRERRRRERSRGKDKDRGGIEGNGKTGVFTTIDSTVTAYLGNLPASCPGS